MSTEATETVVIMGEAITASRLIWQRFLKPMPGLVERFYEINPNLSLSGGYLPLGASVKIPIPAAKIEPEVKLVRLWG